jgi:drug/metabolite transporter (DMT)-like permease
VAGRRTQPDRRPGPTLADRCGLALSQSAAPTPRRSPHLDLRSSGGSLTAVLLALAASLSWGVGDFIGGFKTRRLGAFAVLFISQPPTLLLIAAIVIIRGTPIAPGPWVVAGIVAGLVGLVGLSAVYRGMAIGVVSVVSTIAATGPVVPIIIGLLLGERPSFLQFGGIVVALAGIALLAFDRRPQATGKLLPGVGLALLAALAFGVFLVAIRYASRPDPLWGVLATRSGSVLALLLLGLAFRSRIKAARADLPPLVAVGVLDVSADVFFAFATTIGLLSIVSILSSLYPVATVILARIVLKERMVRVQQVGIALALTGVLLISV